MGAARCEEKVSGGDGGEGGIGEVVRAKDVTRRGLGARSSVSMVTS